MPLSYNNNIPQPSSIISATQAPILTNFQSIDSAFNDSVIGNFTRYNIQNTTSSFAAKPSNPLGVLSTIASANGNPELSWINNVNAAGAGPYTATQITGGGITSAAYVQFNGVSGVVVGASYNVTSVVRNSLGNYTVNFTRNFTTTTYVVQITALVPGINGIGFSAVRNVASYNFSLNKPGGGNADGNDINLVFFGTLV